LPEALIARLKVLANQRDVPYQSLLKVLLAERLKQAEATPVRTLRPAQSLPHSLRSEQALSADSMSLRLAAKHENAPGDSPP
jgi:hypothetical protein